MTVRAKMVCNTRTELSCKSSYGEVAMKVEFGAVWEGTAADGNNAATENRIFGDATPTGSISLMICNPEAFNQFKAGETYYVDFTPTGKKVEYSYDGLKQNPDGSYVDETGKRYSADECVAERQRRQQARQ